MGDWSTQPGSAAGLAARLHPQCWKTVMSQNMTVNRGKQSRGDRLHPQEAQKPQEAREAQQSKQCWRMKRNDISSALRRPPTSQKMSTDPDFQKLLANSFSRPVPEY